jgi:hypothetical protein
VLRSVISYYIYHAWDLPMMIWASSYEMHRNTCINCLTWSIGCHMHWLKVEKRSYRECAGKKSPSISSECVGLRETYFNCKRGQACFLIFILHTLFSFSCISFHMPTSSSLVFWLLNEKPTANEVAANTEKCNETAGYNPSLKGPDLVWHNLYCISVFVFLSGNTVHI